MVLVWEPQSLGLGLRLGTLKSRSRFSSWYLRVLVLVLDPSSLGLSLGLGTWDSDTFKQLHSLLKSLLSACHLCSCGKDILPQWFAEVGKYG